MSSFWLCLSFGSSVWVNEAVKQIRFSWPQCDLLKQQTGKHRCFALKVNWYHLVSILNPKALVMRRLHWHGKALSEFEDCISTGRKAADIVQLVFSLFNFLSFQIPWVFPLVFYSSAAEVWRDRDHVAFQVTFKSNYSFLVGALGLRLPWSSVDQAGFWYEHH